MITTIIVAGILGLGILGVAGSRRRNMSEWTVAGRSFPRWTSWFLQAGEALTTFSFLGIAGIAYAGGVSAVFAIAYLTASVMGLYFVSPRIRELGAARGYLTMSDFFADRFRSRTLSVVVTIVGAVFLVPYLALQITGLGLIVELATGSSSARGLSMVLASALVVLFVCWAGIRGIARVSVFKDFGMVIALAVVAIGVVIAAGGFPEVFRRVAETNELLLTTHAPGYDTTFFITAVVVTTIGGAFNVFAHSWPAALAAESGAVLRSNYKWMAIYQLLLFMPVTVGMAAVLLVPGETARNGVLFSVSQIALPEWVVALVAVCGAAAAMVPAAAIAMGISSMLAQSMPEQVSDRTRFHVNRVLVAMAVAAALSFSLAGSDIGALLLLTYGGLTQLAPAIAAGLADRVRISAAAAISGITVGTGLVAIITFAEIPIGSWDSGLIALGPNLLVTAAVELAVRTRRGPDRAEVAVAGSRAGNGGLG